MLNHGTYDIINGDFKTAKDVHSYIVTKVISYYL